jgi:ABC-type ATPase involved in cell division
MPDTILQFDNVGYRTDSDLDSSLSDVSFSLPKGEILLVRVDADDEHAPVLDLALGLLRPDEGTVSFAGKDWQSMDPFEEAAERGRIGCVFESSGWLSSLSVEQNVLLRVRHHSHRSETSIREEAEALAQIVGLQRLSALRPDHASRRQLRLHEWVRACMGEPELLILAFPERDAPSYALPRLFDLVEHVLSTGTAVLWMTDSEKVWSHERLCSASRSSIENEKWISLRGRLDNEA